ncbi:MAG: phosphoribosylanthranilate isomerase [Pseudomonadota bacterium]
MWIKLCGLTTHDDVAVAVACGVSAIGFVFAESPRAVLPQRAAELAAVVPDNIATVAVMLRPGQAELGTVLRAFSPDYVQADWQALRTLTLPNGIEAMPVHRERDGAPLPDAPHPFVYEGIGSGQGKAVDWPIAAACANGRHLILAGGLDPDNVGEAVRAVAPFGVDVSSGIERERGVKDPARMRAFVTNVRRAMHTPP